MHANPTGAKRLSASPTSIWRNWPLVTAGGILLLLVIVALPILPSILNQLSQHNPSTSAFVHATPTPTPILSPLSGSHGVYPTLANGVIYIGASDGAITAVRASDGSQLWQHKTSGAAYAPLVINGMVYASDYIGNNGPAHLYALRVSDGKLLWSYPTEASADNFLVTSGVAYLTSTDGTVAALRTTNGALLWHYTIPGQVFNTPLVDGDTVYIGAATGIVYALKANTGVLRWSYLTKVSQ